MASSPFKDTINLVSDLGHIFNQRLSVLVSFLQGRSNQEIRVLDTHTDLLIGLISTLKGREANLWLLCDILLIDLLPRAGRVPGLGLEIKSRYVPFKTILVNEEIVFTEVLFLQFH
jgi:hypothetical protein